MEAGNAPIQAMVGVARSGYHGDKGWTCSNLGVEGVGGGGVEGGGRGKGIGIGIGRERGGGRGRGRERIG